MNNLNKINVNELTAIQKKNYRFQKVASALADFGFNAIRLTDDLSGADFSLHHIDGGEPLKVILKGRAMIAKKYIDEDLHICFPDSEGWYFLKHDALVDVIAQHTNWLSTESWIAGELYSTPTLSSSLKDQLSGFFIQS